MLSFGKLQAYSAVATDDKIGEDGPIVARRRQPLNWLSLFFAFALSWTITGGIGYLVGSSRSRSVSYGIGIDEIINVSSMSWTFEHNETFSKAPSTLTNKAWEAIFPDGHGFMKHPELAPQLSVLAVYHQLHCLVSFLERLLSSHSHFLSFSLSFCPYFLGHHFSLPLIFLQDGIRHGYHTALLGLSQDPYPTDLEDMGKPEHIMHCFDYLRQSLMCHADTNIEPVVSEFAGARGFGTAHHCRDYGRANEWMKKWEHW